MEALRCSRGKLAATPGPTWPLRRAATAPGHQVLRLPDRSTPTVLLGRSRDCDVVLSDLSVSRHHAALVLYAGGWFVLDRNSTNGTWLNGRRIWGASSVRPGDRLGLGRTSFRLVGG